MLNKLTTGDLQLITSGFFIPRSLYYSPVEESDFNITSILARFNTSDTENYTKYLQSNNVCRSDHINASFLEYSTNDTPENYYNLVLLAHEILHSVTLSEFIYLQANNHLSSCINFKFCMDLFKYLTDPKYPSLLSKNNEKRDFQQSPLLSYNSISYNIRFSREGVSKSVLDKRRSIFNTEVVKNCSRSMEETLSLLACSPSDFAIFYKYVLTDSF